MPSHFSLEYFDPPAELDRHVLATFYFATDLKLIEDRHPGALPQLFINLHGEGAARFGDRSDMVGANAFLFSGFSAAVPIRMDGPWHAIGASLSPLGWAALTGKSSSKYIDRIFPAEELLGLEITDFSKDLIDRYRAGLMAGPDACQALADWLLPKLNDVAPAHEVVIEEAVAWLGSSFNPELSDLFVKLAYSRRQVERLVERYFGLPPAALLRKYRAVRAAALLSQAELSDEAEAEIADAFVDQPHMIREIRTYCGYTPSRLGGHTDPLFQTLLQMKNFDRFGQFRAVR